MKRPGPHADFQLVGARIVARRIETPVESPEHDLQPVTLQNNNARGGFAHQRVWQLGCNSGNLAADALAQSFLRTDLADVAHPI